MFTLNAENRNTELKPKQLRRKGVIPGVLYGKSLEESLSIQFSQTEVTRFLSSASVGSRTDLVVEGKKHLALLREVSYKPATSELEHLSFQALLAGEPVTSTARIVLVNREKVVGMVQQPQSEISFKALPANLVDRIEVDLDGLQIGDSMRIGDLDFAKNPDIEILSPLDNMVFSISEARVASAEPEAEGEAAEGEAAEAPADSAGE